MCVRDAITNFTGDFRQQIDAIVGLTRSGTSEEQIGLYRKTLLVTVLDCLAGIRFDKKSYPELTKQNRQRFKRFVDEYGDWPVGGRVSTPFLVTRLEKKTLAGPLLDKVRSHLAQFDPEAGNSESLEKMDFTLEELRLLVRREAEERALEDVQHWSLLYRYRNHLVHEFREPGYGMEVFAKDNGAACYHSYANDPQYYLVYPSALFESIARTAIDNLERYFVAQELNPYRCVSTTSRW
ncbi:MAG: hypothetical protein ACRESZ_01150 [Methylococcales bacterium]